MVLKALNLNVQTTLVTTTLGAIIFLGLYLYKRMKKNAIPTTWEPVGKVISLFMYPLKSGRRMELETAQCTNYGFRFKGKPTAYLRDRCMVVYKASNKEFKTARTYPKLLLISTVPCDEDHFNLTASGMENLKLTVPTVGENVKPDEVVMWVGEKVFMIDCGDEAAQWVSRFILGESSGLRLGFHNGSCTRNINETHAELLKICRKLSNSSMGMYADLSSYMLMNQSSVDELISRIPNSNVTMNNFRPNIVVQGEKTFPYSEDSWDWIKIGSAIFRNVKPCTRCVLTTIDPETAIKSREHEPIKTLNTYRKLKDLTNIQVEGDSTVMGINMEIHCTKEISVGDTVYIGKN